MASGRKRIVRTCGVIPDVPLIQDARFTDAEGRHENFGSPKGPRVFVNQLLPVTRPHWMISAIRGNLNFFARPRKSLHVNLSSPRLVRGVRQPVAVYRKRRL